MSFERESTLDPRPNRPTDPRLLLAGYALGLAAMAPSPLMYYWLFAPLGALLAAGACVLVSLVRPSFNDAARGAVLAALFGALVVLVFFIGIVRQ